LQDVAGGGFALVSRCIKANARIALSSGTGSPNVNMRYKVEPKIVKGCDCDDCQAGRHIYSLYRWNENAWHWAATSLRTYSSAEDCQRLHWWGIVFGPGAIWEDGSPVVEPDPARQAHPDGAPSTDGGMVLLDKEALRKSADLLERHWRAG
jgi:hypothetical protein